MNRDRFHALVKAPLEESMPEREALLGLSARYPWFQSAHLLLCLADHRSESLHYPSSLKRAAVYAYNREVLYKLIMEPALSSAMHKFDEEVGNDPTDFTERQLEPNHEAQAKEELTAAPPPESHPAAAVPPEPESANPEEHVTAPVGSVQPDSGTTVGLTAADELEHEPDVLGKVETLETQPHRPVKATDFDALQKEILIEAITSSIEQEVSSGDVDDEREIKSPEPGETIENDRFVDATAHLSAYARWLLRRASAVPSEMPTEHAHEDPRSKQLALIDRFIQTDPKITPGKADLFTTENLAKMSLVEDEEFVTETMAMIYARQGNLRKAERAYKLLALKYPEKSVYFANQIKKLRDRPKPTS